MADLLDDINVALPYYPKLKVDKNRGLVVGEIDLINPDTGRIIESYLMEFSFPKLYPHSKIPIAREVSEIILRNESRHVYADGIFCLTTPLREFMICKTGISFKKYLDEIVLPFLAVQYAITAGWMQEFPQGEFGHGHAGIYETYKEYFNITSPLKIIQGLNLVSARGSRNSPCFCESGLKYKKCHINEVASLVKMDKDTLNNDIKSLIEYCSENSLNCMLQ